MPYNVTGYNIINGTPAGESITGTAVNDAIYGNGGVDTLNGGAGRDVLFGAAGSVTFVYNPDGIWAASNAVNTGDPGYPGTGTTFSLAGFSQSHDVFVGTGTNNTLVLPNGNHALFLEDSLSPSADPIRLVNIQTIVAGNGGQIIDLTSTTASYGNVTIIGGTGSDVLLSNAGHDTISGGDGNDYLWGGSGNDTLSGGAGNDRVLGGTGSDRLDGGTGNDTLTGGADHDIYIIDSANDTVVEAANEGTDSVYSSVSYTLAANTERLFLTGSAVNGTGNTLNNYLVGNAQNNTLDGLAGIDTMAGGAGNDTYIVDNVADVVIEVAGEGIDTVRASSNYVLGAEIENLVLLGSASITGTGNALANTITGNSGANIINGGAGNDTMQGGNGSDTYIVDSAGDVIIESNGSSAGNDLVQASASYTLGANVERLTLVGTGNINGTGNSSNNVIIGNAGHNVLSGGGGTDTISGGAGNDTYIIDGTSDIVSENAAEGTDLIMASFNYTLLSNFENLTLTGTSNLAGTGNSVGNVVTGNAGNNTLSGLDGNDILDGGLGNDTLNGGAGNDTFVVERAGDLVVEAANQGTDLVQSSITYTLTGNVENLQLTGVAVINGTGNTLANKINGNSANNTLSGLDGNDQILGEHGDDTLFGGNGNDHLNGGAGNDRIFGGAGNDGFFGGGANDMLSGEAGDDKLYGDGGNDTISGGAGNDLLFGGQLGGNSIGNDTFTWQRADVVTGTGQRIGYDTVGDFLAGDRLDFTGVFTGHPPAAIADLVRVTDTAAGTVIALRIDNTIGFIDTVILKDVHNLDLDDLISQNGIFV